MSNFFRIEREEDPGIEEMGVVGVQEVRYVNEKQWERILKRRVQKELRKMRKLRQEGRDPERE